jgi:hypothetical protein
MAAFVSGDPNDREAFDAHMAQVRSAPGTRNRAITRDGHLVGSIASFVIEGDTEITYWIDRSVWGAGTGEHRTDALPAAPPGGCGEVSELVAVHAQRTAGTAGKLTRASRSASAQIRLAESRSAAAR